MPVDEEEWEEGELPSDLVNLSDNPGPGPSSPALDQPTEPHPPTEEAPEEGASEQDTEPLPEFDQRFRQDFEGLLYIGRLSRTFNWLGHSFEIRTLTTEEVLEVGLVHKDYAETVSDIKAYQAALVAACMVAVDGQPMPVPLSTEPSDTGLINRFRTVVRWFPPTLDAVYNEYLKLEERVSLVIEAMGKVPG